MKPVGSVWQWSQHMRYPRLGRQINGQCASALREVEAGGRVRSGI